MFIEQSDKNKIIQIGGFIQEWINIMEYMDGGYHLNLSGINDFNTLWRCPAECIVTSPFFTSQ